ncbi:MAG TPA: HNH endonuclease [Ferruginibacter sp.]|nr:HNH endonuclease [Ferruginibacter sp.]
MLKEMKKHSIKKETLFNIYSKNLSWVKEHPSISFKPDFGEAYLCPLCFDPFTRESLNPACANPLTFDHNPPESLGGKQGVLTCKNCNSKAGHDLDNQLLARLNELDFIELNPNSKARTTLESDNYKVTTDIFIDKDKTFKINIDRKNSNPKHVDNFLANKKYTYKGINSFLENDNLLESGLNWQLNFKMKVPTKSIERNAEIALLKIAYLYAFQKFGNGFLINGGLYKVREQILNPEKNILPKVFWLKYDFPEDAIGLNIVSNSKDLQCFLVIFNLSTKSCKRQFAIALPGASAPGVEIYKNIESILCQNKEGFSSVKLEHLCDRDYLTEKRFAFASHLLWKKLTSPE